MKLRTSVFFLSFLLAAAPLPGHAKTKPIPVKVVVVAMFEVGEDTGDQPGELQYWVERDHLDRIYPLPAGYHAVRMSADGEMAVLTGQGTAQAAATIMALGLDPRFDFSHAYWLIAGIAGGTPERISLGSAAWARWVVDGDLGYEIDSRETPADWSTGYLPLRKTKPFFSVKPSWAVTKLTLAQERRPPQRLKISPEPSSRDASDAGGAWPRQ